VIVINGSFPVADTSQLTFTLTGPAGSIALTPYELNEKSDWFGDLCVKLPDALEKGAWRMNVASLDDGTQVELPISIHIE